MNLVVDKGNTRTKLALFNKDRMIDHIVLEKNDMFTLQKFITSSSIDGVIYSSVASIGCEVLKFLKKIFPQLLELNSLTPLPIKNNYEGSTLGMDRLASAVGAYYRNPQKKSLVIDAGTAVTYDIIDEKGIFQGGAISPGLSIRFQSLNQFTQNLPVVNLSENIEMVGKDTNSCIRSGVYRGMLFEIEGQITFFKNLYPEIEIFFTGGDTKYFDKKINYSIFAVPFLAEEGLNRILIHYEGKD